MLVSFATLQPSECAPSLGLSTEGPRRIKAATAPSIARETLRECRGYAQSSRQAPRNTDRTADTHGACREPQHPVSADRQLTAPEAWNSVRNAAGWPGALCFVRALLLTEQASKIES